MNTCLILIKQYTSLRQYPKGFTSLQFVNDYTLATLSGIAITLSDMEKGK